MKCKSIAILAISLAGSVLAQTPCSPKIFDEGQNSCASLEGKPDTARMIFVILFERPRFDEEDLPENQAKLRKWTDSLFLKYDLRSDESSSTRELPPSDSSLSWSIKWYWIQKSEVLSIAAEEFVTRLEYRSESPHTVIVSSSVSRPPAPKISSPEYFEINGRSVRSEQAGSRASGASIKRFQRQNR